jgi:hypothetical protein
MMMPQISHNQNVFVKLGNLIRQEKYFSSFGIRIRYTRVDRFQKKFRVREELFVHSRFLRLEVYTKNDRLTALQGETHEEVLNCGGN